MLHRCRILIALLLTTAVSFPAVGAIVSVTADGQGNGVLSATQVETSDLIVAAKRYDSVGPMSINIEVDSDGYYIFREHIFNNTGISWTDFHWDVVGDTDGRFAVAVGPESITPFTNVEGQITRSLDIFGGALPDGNLFSPYVLLRVVNSSAGGFFTLIQTPTVVPIPAAAWLFGSALLGLGALKRKKA